MGLAPAIGTMLTKQNTGNKIVARKGANIVKGDPNIPKADKNVRVYPDIPQSVRNSDDGMAGGNKIPIPITSKETTNAATYSQLKLSVSDKRAIRSLEKRIKEHENKIVEFKNNPTIRPGMEHLPKDIIRRQHERRIAHLEREIRAFQKSINDILKKGN